MKLIKRNYISSKFMKLQVDLYRYMTLQYGSIVYPLWSKLISSLSIPDLIRLDNNIANIIGVVKKEITNETDN